MKPILEVKNVTKRYKIGSAKNQVQTFREALVSFGKSNTNEYFNAINEVSFNLFEGDTLGVIGKNGAGKSTLLKILSKITYPTYGEIIFRANVSSLLEVGTGFHSELTGRENIFMNGSILGMKRAEILSGFDEIVEFSGVSKFIDTPIKHYSSGMQMRLAFAVAAHLNPDILIIDEVLAVGDADFQKKCILKMENISKSGKTLIFVSHNLSSVNQLCKNSIYLEKGKMMGFGETSAQIQSYLSQNKFIEKGSAQLSKYLSLDEFSMGSGIISSFDSVDYYLKFSAKIPQSFFSLGIMFYDLYDQRVAILDLRRHDKDYKCNANESLEISGKIESMPFVEGEYKVGIFLQTQDISDNFFDIITLQVIYKSSDNKIAPYPKEYRGFIELKYISN